MKTMADTWREIDPRVRGDIVDLLRGQVLSAWDQAERFRDPESKHRSEEVARQWDFHARIYDDAMLRLTGKRVRRDRSR